MTLRTQKVSAVMAEVQPPYKVADFVALAEFLQTHLSLDRELSVGFGTAVGLSVQNVIDFD